MARLHSVLTGYTVGVLVAATIATGSASANGPRQRHTHADRPSGSCITVQGQAYVNGNPVANCPRGSSEQPMRRATEWADGNHPDCRRLSPGSKIVRPGPNGRLALWRCNASAAK